MRASQANSPGTTRQPSLQIRRGADLTGLPSTCPPLSTEREGFAFTHPERDISASHKPGITRPLWAASLPQTARWARRTRWPLAARRLTRRERLSERPRRHPLSDRLARSKPALTGNEYGRRVYPQPRVEQPVLSSPWAALSGAGRRRANVLDLAAIRCGAACRRWRRRSSAAAFRQVSHAEAPDCLYSKPGRFSAKDSRRSTSARKTIREPELGTVLPVIHSCKELMLTG